MEWELLAQPGSDAKTLSLDSTSAMAILKEAVAEAEGLGLTWLRQPLKLRPTAQLVALVRKSQLAAQSTAEGDD
jgi:CRISPR-associated protein Csb1